MLDLVFLGVVSMVNVRTTTGVNVMIPDEAVAVVTGPYPYDESDCTYIRGSFGPGAVQTGGRPESFVASLELGRPLVQLTRPTGDPVWIKASAVNMIRYPLDTELFDERSGLLTRCVVFVGSFHQAIREDVQTARQMLISGGLDIASLDADHFAQHAADI
jgi:hypothetical protein